MACESRSKVRSSGSPYSRGMRLRASPNSTANSSTCSTSPSAKAPTTLCGTMWVKNSTQLMPPWAAAVYLAASAACAADCAATEARASRPRPGWARLAAPMPMASASVVMISKYSRALPPTRPTFFRSPMPPMPSTTVRKMMGAMSILIRAMNVSPTGLSAAPACGNSAPTSTPSPMAASTWKVRLAVSFFISANTRKKDSVARSLCARGQLACAMALV